MRSSGVHSGGGSGSRLDGHWRPALAAGSGTRLRCQSGVVIHYLRRRRWRRPADWRPYSQIDGRLTTATGTFRQEIHSQQARQAGQTVRYRLIC